MCNGKCNGKRFSSLGVRPMVFPQVSLGPKCRVTLSVFSSFGDVRHLPKSIAGQWVSRNQTFAKVRGKSPLFAHIVGT